MMRTDQKTRPRGRVFSLKVYLVNKIYQSPCNQPRICIAVTTRWMETI